MLYSCTILEFFPFTNQIFKGLYLENGTSAAMAVPFSKSV